MPVETVVTRCGNCGAPLQRVEGATSLTCGYCQQVTWLAPTAHATEEVPRRAPRAPVETATADDDDLHDRLMRGPGGAPHGRARRLQPTEHQAHDPRTVERALWPTRAEASSTYGGTWSPSTLLGPPRVYPNSGDIPGAWAPGPSRSAVEWVEARFEASVAVVAVRVYETHRAGSAFAVVDVSGEPRLLYAGPVTAESGARVLEVSLDAPRVVRAVRVYVVNPGWTEIDTVSLVAAEPLPMELRAKPVAVASATTGCAAAVVALAVIVGVALAVGWYVNRPRALPDVSGRVSGSRFAYGGALPDREVVWAAEVVDRSTEYDSARNGAVDVVGAPDVFPRSGDLDGAWASKSQDEGYEWITVRFARPVQARAVVWAETFNPGAVVRVDDVSVSSRPVALWSGDTGRPGGGSAVAAVTLEVPRELTAVRVVLDTRRVAGWNEIDAIGLVPTGH